MKDNPVNTGEPESYALFLVIIGCSVPLKRSEKNPAIAIRIGHDVILQE